MFGIFLNFSPASRAFYQMGQALGSLDFSYPPVGWAHLDSKKKAGYEACPAYPVFRKLELFHGTFEFAHGPEFIVAILHNFLFGFSGKFGEVF